MSQTEPHRQAMQQNFDARVCIIGAGPSGITAGKNLLQAGVRNFVIYEKSDQVGGNWVFTPKPSTVVDLTLSANNYSEGNILSEVALGYTPGSVGLPAYLDAKAGANHAVPVVTWSTYTGAKAYETLGQSVPGWNRYQVYAIKSNLTHIRGSHTPERLQ